MGSKSSAVIKLQEDFNLPRYMGTWYEQMRDKTFAFQKFDGVHEKYTLNKDNSVFVQEGETNHIKNRIDTMTGKLSFSEGPKGTVKFFWWLPAGDYRVIATDYDNYTVIYSSQRFLWHVTRAAWIMTRDKNPDPEIVKKAFGKLKEQVPAYTWEDFHQTKQGESFNYSGWC